MATLSRGAYVRDGVINSAHIVLEVSAVTRVELGQACSCSSVQFQFVTVDFWKFVK